MDDKEGKHSRRLFVGGALLSGVAALGAIGISVFADATSPRYIVIFPILTLCCGAVLQVKAYRQSRKKQAKLESSLETLQRNLELLAKSPYQF